MTGDEVNRALSHLVVATPGWTDEAAEEYVEQLIDLTDGAALERACISIARGWEELRRPPIALILDTYDRCCLAVRTIDPRRVHCNGSGWLQEGTDLVPCPRCSPALADVWADPIKLRRWRDGTPLDWLGVGVETVHGRQRWTGSRPPECTPAPDGDTPPVADGVAVAWAAYSEDQMARGITPSREHFREMTGR